MKKQENSTSHEFGAFLNRLMFWNSQGGYKVKKSNLDGTQCFAIVTSNIIWPNGITLDRRNKLVYWVETWNGAVNSVDYNGNNRTLLFQQNYFSSDTVSLISPYLFVIGQHRNRIYKIDVFNGTLVGVKSLSHGRVWGLVAYYSYRQTSGL